jgi:methanethiol S-methyltransferase
MQLPLNRTLDSEEGWLPVSTFRTPLFYKWVRHPIYLGFMIALWSASTVSQGHLLFAIATTRLHDVSRYFCIFLEERDLVAHWRKLYCLQERVSMMLPLPKTQRKEYWGLGPTSSSS